MDFSIVHHVTPVYLICIIHYRAFYPLSIHTVDDMCSLAFFSSLFATFHSLSLYSLTHFHSLSFMLSFSLCSVRSLCGLCGSHAWGLQLYRICAHSLRAKCSRPRIKYAVPANKWMNESIYIYISVILVLITVWWVYDHNIHFIAVANVLCCWPSVISTTPFALVLWCGIYSGQRATYMCCHLGIHPTISVDLLHAVVANYNDN